MSSGKLSEKEAFYFFTSVGNFTGVSAASLEDFLKDIKEVDVKSLEFHLERRDFEKWVTDVLKDPKLAREIRYLRNRKPTGENLRTSFYNIVSVRFKELTKDISKI